MAVVVRTVDFKDNDRMITFLTKDYGLMSAKARGAKKQTGKLFCASSLFCCGEYTFYEKNGFFGVRGAHVKHSFGHLQDDYDAYAAACFIADAASKVAQEDFAAPKLFALVVNALYALDIAAVSPDTAVAYFAQRLLIIEGLYPILDHCVYCGSPNSLTHFSIGHGGAVCGACAHHDDAAVISREVMNALTGMQPVLPVDMAQVNMDETTAKQTRDLLIAMIEHALQKPLRTTKYIRDGNARNNAQKLYR